MWKCPLTRPSPSARADLPPQAGRGKFVVRSSIMTTIPEEAKNFKLLGHDPSAAWGGGSIVEINNGFAYVGAVGSASYNGPEGFTVHDVRDPRKPKKVAEVKSPPGVHWHKLRVVDGDI